ncbi:MAG: hypothetical protein JSW46_06465, partial [Gemmatimonadota bacterium]
MAPPEPQFRVFTIMHSPAQPGNSISITVSGRDPTVVALVDTGLLRPHLCHNRVPVIPHTSGRRWHMSRLKRLIVEIHRRSLWQVLLIYV